MESFVTEGECEQKDCEGVGVDDVVRYDQDYIMFQQAGQQGRTGQDGVAKCLSVRQTWTGPGQTGGSEGHSAVFKEI